MRVRRVDEAGDMRFGRNQADFWHDVPDGVGQIVESRLNLWVGQWYLDLDAGTPYQTDVLGHRTEATRDPVLQDRILGTPGVVEIVEYGSVLNRQTRAFDVRAVIDTVYSGPNARGQNSTATTVATSIYRDR